MITIEVFNAKQARAALPQLSALLRDGVESGASIGFVLPLAEETVQQFWADTCEGLEADDKLLLVASEGTSIVGMVMLALVTKPNGTHRAEVQKLIVHTEHRQHGIGRALMQQLESIARAYGRTLLVLDTREGDPSNHLYRTLGYIAAGMIPDFAHHPSEDALEATIFYYKRLSG